MRAAVVTSGRLPIVEALATLAELKPAELRERVTVLPLLEHEPVTPMRMRLARPAAAVLWPRLARRQRVLFIGEDVPRAFRINPRVYTALAWWWHPAKLEFAWMPNPIRAPWWYYDRATRRRAARLIHDLLLRAKAA